MALTVLVTGGSSGFGVAIATAFAARGDRVVVTRRDGRPSVDASGGGSPSTIATVQLDVTSEASRLAAVTEVTREHGPVDVLVNNAGIMQVGALEDVDADTEQQVFATNYHGPLALTRLVLPGMRERGHGRVVNVTAIGAVLCTPFLATYCASKHALDAATAAMDLEVRPFGVRALSVLPGAFRTSIVAKMTDGRDTDAYAAAAGRFREGITERIESAPSDLSPVADAVVAAATDDDPPQRRLVGGPEHLGPVVEDLDRLHDLEARRLGLV